MRALALAAQLRARLAPKGLALRGHAFVLLAAVPVLGVSTPLAAQTDQKAPGGTRSPADAVALETVSGMVIGVERAPAPGDVPHDGVRLIVSTATGMLTVILGPDWYVDTQQWMPGTGELVEIAGRHVDDDRGTAFEATAVRAGVCQLALRLPSGVPLWAGRGTGHAGGAARGRGYARIAVRRHHDAEGDSSITGVVRDASGLPVPGAAVGVAPSGHAVVTDEHGTYSIAALLRGRCRITAKLPGFAPVSSEPIMADAGLAWLVDFVLAPEFTEDVVVTGTRTEKLLADTPIRTDLIARPIMEAATVRTLADAVEFTPGIRVENDCQNCNFQQVRMLGLDGAYTQILVDGQPTMSSLAMVYGVDQIPARMIDRIEVVKGGGSALYGSGAVGGIINIIPHEPYRTGGVVEGRLEALEGSVSESVSVGGDWVASNQQTAATVFGQLDQLEPIDIDGDGFTELSRRKLRAFGGRLARYLMDSRAKLTLDVSRISEDRRGGNLLQLPPHEADLAEATWMTRHTAAVSWFHTLSPRLDYRLVVSLANMDRDSYYGSGRDPNAYGESASTVSVVDGQINHRLGRHVLSWGGQGQIDSLQDAQPSYGRVVDESYKSLGFYVQDDWSFHPGLELVYGFRADVHSALDQPILSPRGALRYSPDAALTVRASFGTGFRAPQVFDEDLHITQVAGEGQIIRLDPNLREERSTNWTLGAEWTPAVGRGQGFVEATLFHTRLRDLFHNVEADDPETPEAEFLKTNLGGARAYGIEANLGWGVGKTFKVQGGLVAQRARFDEPEPDFGSREFLRTPNLYGTLVVTFRTAVLGECFLGLRYTGSMKAPHYAGFIDEDRLETTRSFWTVDASVSRPVLRWGERHLVLLLAGKNLTNAYQDDFDRGIDRDAGYVYGPRFPRSVSLTMKVSF